jgi:hypothetical protein
MQPSIASPEPQAVMPVPPQAVLHSASAPVAHVPATIPGQQYGYVKPPQTEVRELPEKLGQDTPQISGPGAVQQHFPQGWGQPPPMATQSPPLQQALPKGQQPNVDINSVVAGQPQPEREMKYEEPNEERARKIRQAKHCLGQTCIVCGKMCTITMTIAVAVCSCIVCLASCIPSDSPGIVGGMPGLTNFGMSDS